MLDRIASTPEERATNDWAVIRRLWTYMRDDWRDLLVMLVFLILSAGSQAGGPALIGIAIDRFITEGNSVGLRNAMLGLLVVYVLGFIGFVGQVRILGRVAQRLLKRLRTDIFEHVQRLSLKYFSGGQAGDLMSRLVNDTDVIGNLFSQSLTQSLGAIFALIGIVVAMFLYNWQLALATLTVIPVMFLVTAFFSRRARSAFRETRETLGQLSTNLEEGISSVRESQAFGRTQQNIQQFQRNNTAYRNSSVRAGRHHRRLCPHHRRALDHRHRHRRGAWAAISRLRGWPRSARWRPFCSMPSASSAPCSRFPPSTPRRRPPSPPASASSICSTSTPISLTNPTPRRCPPLRAAWFLTTSALATGAAKL